MYIEFGLVNVLQFHTFTVKKTWKPAFLTPFSLYVIPFPFPFTYLIYYTFYIVSYYYYY